MRDKIVSCPHDSSMCIWMQYEGGVNGVAEDGSEISGGMER